jgi:hypothetical protein
MWPFDIFAKRRAAAEAREHAEHQARMDQVKTSIEAEKRRQWERAVAVSRALDSRPPVSIRRQTSASAAPSNPATRHDDDFLNPAHPLSPLNPINQAASYSAPAEEPRHSSSHCGSSSSHSSHSSSDYSSSHSHSSHDHGCSSSSYDSGSSSSSSDW